MHEPGPSAARRPRILLWQIFELKPRRAKSELQHHCDLMAAALWCALDFQTQAQHLQSHGAFESALSLMAESVRLRESHPTCCLALCNLADLYLEMLKPDEAEKVASRMLMACQKHIAHDIIADVRRQRAIGLIHGQRALVHCVLERPDLNGRGCVLRGRCSGTGLYYVDIGSERLLLHCRHFTVPTLSPMVIPIGATASVAEKHIQTESEEVQDLGCVVCFSAPRTHLLYPCGHLLLCGSCAKQVFMAAKSQKKPMCCLYCRRRSKGFQQVLCVA